MLAVLQACNEAGVAVVPFGGGTSVVGGLEPLRGPFEALISLDLARFDDVVVDARSRTATLGAGLRLPEADRALKLPGPQPNRSGCVRCRQQREPSRRLLMSP